MKYKSRLQPSCDFLLRRGRSISRHNSHAFCDINLIFSMQYGSLSHNLESKINSGGRFESETVTDMNIAILNDLEETHLYE